VDEELGAVLDHDMMDHSILRLPSEKLNAERWVPGGCAICLDLYKEGDVVAWSTELLVSMHFIATVSFHG
jgi:hypothetical protein